MVRPTLRARWLARVPYEEAYDLQHCLFDARVAGEAEDYLLLLEHPHTYTLGRRARREHLLLAPEDYEALGARVLDVDRGGDVTYHGPGQLVAYPILRLGAPDVVAHVRAIEEIVVRTLADFGISAGRQEGHTGVWTGVGKIAAIGCRVTRGVTMHGTALNLATESSMWEHIVPCGIPHAPVASMAGLLGDAPSMQAVAERFVSHAGEVFDRDVSLVADAWPVASHAVTPLPIRSPRAAAVEAGPGIREQARGRPAWLKRRACLSDGNYLDLLRLMRSLDLHTVCEEAGCPNIYECWRDRTATLMLLGARCTRACGFCDVDTGRPAGLDEDEPNRAAEAIEKMGLAHAVLTSVARDDLADGGAHVFAAAIRAVRDRAPDCRVEVLVPDFRGDARAARAVCEARPDVFNHNIETVARLQRLVRPQATYARSLTLLARAHRAGLVTKSGIMCGLGESDAEILDAMRDLRAVGVQIVTLGQYLRPTGRHLPVDRWLTPEEFEALRKAGEAMGFPHVEAGPLVRSSYHARQAAAWAAT